jgi:tRNA nucleotidyltransferase (CCA-adding enzyme)
VKLPEVIPEISSLFLARDVLLYLVGGFVRNAVIGISGGDVDVCSAAAPDKAADIARSAGLTVVPKAPELGTVELHLHRGGKTYIFEHTTFRSDVYPTGGQHRPSRVAFTDDIKKDARRRDFTANAMYLNTRTGQTVDPTGRGFEDIKGRVLRAAADDPDVTIRDDGLRIMRMARFAAELGFAVAPELMACAQRRASLLADISAERKRDELKKILLADTKYPIIAGNDAHVRGLSLLYESGALPYVLPVLCEGEGVKQKEQYHKYDVLWHGIQSCGAAPPMLEVRLAALLHDVGKPRALAQGGSMYDHEIIGEAMAREALIALRFDNATRDDTLVLIRNHMFDLEGRAKPMTIRRRAIKLGRENFERLISLRRADFIGSGMMEGGVKSADRWETELARMDGQGVPWRISDLAVSGDDVMRETGLAPSPQVGRVLDALHAQCVENPALNRRETLTARLIAMRGKILQ